MPRIFALLLCLRFGLVPALADYSGSSAPAVITGPALHGNPNSGPGLVVPVPLDFPLAFDGSGNLKDGLVGLPAANGSQYIQFEESGGLGLTNISGGTLPGIFGDYSNSTTNGKHFIQFGLTSLGTAGQITNAINNGSGLCRLSVATTSYLTVGDSVTISGVVGATGCNGSHTISAIGSGTVDIAGTTFGGTWTAPAVTAAGSFVLGAAYQIASIGTTNFVAVGAPSNTVGAWFNATGAGSGTGTALAASAQALIIDTKSVGTPNNNNSIAGDIYTPPDDGGDSSGLYLDQQGGGNALTVYNLCGQTPTGFTAYCNNGFAIEAQVDGAKNAILVAALNGSALDVVVTSGGTSGTGISIAPGSDADGTSRRAIHVQNAANSQENFYVDFAGNTFARSSLIVDGQVALGTGTLNGILNVGGGNVNFAGSLIDTLSNTSSVNAISALVPSLTTGGYAIIGVGTAASAANWGVLLFNNTGGTGSTSNYVEMGVGGTTGIIEFGTGDAAINSTTDCGSILCVAGSERLTGVHISTGTPPTLTTGSCSGSSAAGGATAGKFTAPSCAGGTIIISGLPQSINGYTCWASDQTTVADTLQLTGNSVTSCTFKATTANNDVIAWAAAGW
jgi:hypothetical protein